MSGMLHLKSSQALGKGGPYATRYRPWPPEGFTEPTREELEEALRHRKWINLKRFDVDTLVRWLEVIDWFGPDVYRGKPGVEGHIVDFLHVLRNELRKRPDRRPFFSLRHDRCAMCSHASDRLWEATGETHNLIDRNDEPIKSAFVCARCWSLHAITDEKE